MKAIAILSLVLSTACSPTHSLSRTAAPEFAGTSIPAAEKAAIPKSLPILDDKVGR